MAMGFEAADAALAAAEEREALARESFRKYDVNKNGMISHDEIKLLLNEQLKVVDISEEELKIFFTEEYRKADVNNDGVLEFTEFVTLHNRLQTFLAELKEKRGEGGGAAGREVEAIKAVTKATEDAEATARAEAAAAPAPTKALADGGSWPMWYMDDKINGQDPEKAKAYLQPLWDRLYKEDGKVNIHDLLGDLYKHIAHYPNVARRVGRNLPESADFAGVAFGDINVSFDQLIAGFAQASKDEAQDFWNRAAKDELFEGESKAGVLNDGGSWPVWYKDEAINGQDAEKAGAFLKPLWDSLYKQEDGSVNIHDLIGDLYKHCKHDPNIAHRVGEDVRSAPEFAGVGFGDINFSFELLVRQYGLASRREAEDFWNRAARDELFESEEAAVLEEEEEEEEATEDF